MVRYREDEGREGGECEDEDRGDGEGLDGWIAQTTTTHKKRESYDVMGTLDGEPAREGNERNEYVWRSRNGLARHPNRCNMYA